MSVLIGNDLMTLAEVRRSIRKASAVYAWVNITQDDGQYIQVVKSQALTVFHNQGVRYNEGVKYNAEMRGTELYLN